MREVNVTGLDELQKFLDTFPVKLEKNIMRGALRAGMNVVKPLAQSNIRSVSGLLASGLKVGTRSRGATVTSSLTAKGKHGYVAQWLEFGTRPHLIASKGTGSLRIGSNFVGQTIQHPGAKRRPFMRPALDAQSQNATIAVGNYIKDRLDRQNGIDTSHITIEGDV